MLQKLLSLFATRQATPELALLSTKDFLLDLFERHAIKCTSHDDWVAPRNELPTIRATWYPGQSSGRLEVHAFIREGVLIEECFAGIGNGELGLRDALTNFITNSFHVLLAALWKKNDASQVTTENWNISGKQYTAYIGNFGTRGSEGVTPDIPVDLFHEIEKLIKLEQLSEDIHWFRFFFCNVAGERTVESLKDNEIWDAGVNCLDAIQWTKSPGYYSIRLFIVLNAA